MDPENDLGSFVDDKFTTLETISMNTDPKHQMKWTLVD